MTTRKGEIGFSRRAQYLGKDSFASLVPWIPVQVLKVPALEMFNCGGIDFAGKAQETLALPNNYNALET